MAARERTACRCGHVDIGKCNDRKWVETSATMLLIGDCSSKLIKYRESMSRRRKGRTGVDHASVRTPLTSTQVIAHVANGATTPRRIEEQAEAITDSTGADIVSG